MQPLLANDTEVDLPRRCQWDGGWFTQLWVKTVGEVAELLPDDVEVSFTVVVAE